ncbi:MAG: ribosome maturation factor RimM [Paludibacter sp.]|jgi:16S rRNA processing protein RimM|nr:ribosome maturation factor RimM [Paludibacter sp.]
MIVKEKLLPVGQLIKPHGIHGEMTFEFSSDVFDREKIPFFMLEIDGIMVPFRVQNYRIRSSSAALLQLKGIDSEEKARKMCGSTVYVSDEYLGKMEDDEMEVQYFQGFTLVDAASGWTGTISEVDETTENVLFVVMKDEEEFLIPASPGYIVNVDHDKRIITMELPGGLLEL